MRRDITELKKILNEVMTGDHTQVEDLHQSQQQFLSNIDDNNVFDTHQHTFEISKPARKQDDDEEFDGAEVLEENLSLQKREMDLIKKALEKHHGKRKAAAEELGISERTLYRKIKEYDIN
jgi:DNA-binding NtrC family response regulator